MTKAKAVIRIEQLRREVEAHNRRYYEEAAPTITDREYDELYRELADLEAKHAELDATNSPTQRVSGAPLAAFSQITHRAPMLSLDNTYSEAEVADFYRRVEKLSLGQAVPVVISADKATKYETVVQVMDNLQKAGISRVGLSVQTGAK